MSNVSNVLTCASFIVFVCICVLNFIIANADKAAALLSGVRCYEQKEV